MNKYEYDLLGTIIRTAREVTGLTIETLAARVGITERYLYRIENERQKPSYHVLYRLIRTLHISPDVIFYPEKYIQHAGTKNLVCMLFNCDLSSQEIDKVKDLIETLDEE